MAGSVCSLCSKVARVGGGGNTCVHFVHAASGRPMHHIHNLNPSRDQPQSNVFDKSVYVLPTCQFGNMVTCV